MDTRKVQVTGGSTYTVSLPKGWATSNDVSAGSVIEFHAEEESLVMTPRRENERVEGALDITDLEGEELTQAVITMYINGFDVITLRTDRVEAGQRAAVRDAAQGLVGLEVIEETSDRVMLQDLLDSSELSIHNAITRMRLVALTMLEDALDALCTNDRALATDVMERDQDVNRLWYMTARVFRSVLREPGAAIEVGLDRETCFDYHMGARQLERIADHASKIARLSLDLGEIPPEATEALADLHAEASEIAERAMDALLQDDPDRARGLANEIRADVRTVDEGTREAEGVLRELEPQQAQLLGLVVDSLSRTADYGVNIAESATQKTAPRP
jgi:phosphate uptake regulator